jgi:hypothetical protein
MRYSEMSIAYKLQSNDVQVFYESATESFLIGKTLCANSECNSFWAHRINQCVFCGTRNFFVWICKECNHMISLTASKIDKCQNPECNAENSYFKSCFNDDCVSNTDKNLKSIITKSNNSLSGSFEATSPFKLAQHFCIDCGGERNYIFTKEFKVFDLNPNDKISLNNYKNYLESFDYLVIYSEQEGYCIIEKHNTKVEFHDDIELDRFF